MKLRIIPLGKGKPDPRSFGFQYLNHIKTFYVRLYFVALYLALGKVDIVADYERMKAQQVAQPRPLMNRKMRRTIGALARRSHV